MTVFAALIALARILCHQHVYFRRLHPPLSPRWFPSPGFRQALAALIAALRNPEP
jgi:hypothetical protein